MRSLASFCIRHRRLVVILWIVLLVGMTMASKATGTAYSNSFSLPGTESTKAYALIESVSPKSSGDIERIVIATSGGAKVTDAAVESSVTSMLGRIQGLPHVSYVVSPYSARGASQINVTVAKATSPAALICDAPRAE